MEIVRFYFEAVNYDSASRLKKSAQFEGYAEETATKRSCHMTTIIGSASAKRKYPKTASRALDRPRG